MVNSLPTRNQVVCAIIERNGRFLAAKRKTSQTNGDLWEFPGGKVDKGESLAGALYREITEELGVMPVIQRCLAAVDWEYPWITIQLIPFICTIDENEMPRALDHDEIKFILPSEATSIIWAPADQIVLKQYLSNVTLPVVHPTTDSGELS